MTTVSLERVRRSAIKYKCIYGFSQHFSVLMCSCVSVVFSTTTNARDLESQCYINLNWLLRISSSFIYSRQSFFVPYHLSLRLRQAHASSLASSSRAGALYYHLVGRLHSVSVQREAKRNLIIE